MPSSNSEFSGSVSRGRLVAGEVLNDYDFRRTVCTVHLRVPVLLLQILHEWNVLHVIVELQYGLT